MIGRPKTIDTDHTLAVALHGYWSQGLHGMSVNEVCRRAQISKPSLYREFGGEDGLLAAVLLLYQESVIKVVAQHTKSGKPFNACMKEVVDLLLQQEGRPRGCLLAKFRLTYEDLGELSQQTVVQIVRDVRADLRSWLERSQQAGEITTAFSLDDAARYLDRQMMLASLIAERGGDMHALRKQLEMALWCLAPGLKL